MLRAGISIAAAALLAGCGAKHEPVKLIARPPGVEVPAAAAPPVQPAAAAAPVIAAPVASQPAALPARTVPPVAVAPPARVHQAGDPTGNDVFRAAIDARLRGRASGAP